MACYKFKQHNDISLIKKFKREIREWWDDHKDAENYIDGICLDALKDNEKLTSNDLTKYLIDYMNEHNIEKPTKFHRW